MGLLCIVRKLQTEREKDNLPIASPKAFYVRKKKVLDALHFLDKRSAAYQDDEFEIVEDNLSWMDGAEEAELPCIDVATSVNEQDSSIDEDCKTELDDHGPSLSQVKDVIDSEEYFESVVGCVEPPLQEPTGEARDITKQLELATRQGGSKGIALPWPKVSKIPISEYDATAFLFGRAFPWLFPGGVGDFLDYRKETIRVQDWVNSLMCYYDGRFAKDKLFSFFAINYSQRRKNQTSGSFFVNTFFKQGNKTLSEIQGDLRAGKNEWLDKITYWAGQVRGSSAFWRVRRSEVYSWINYHVSLGHGGPNFFITLSCAEYHWPDIR